jgi:DNA replication initiation complex subunit (GINS family)
MDRIDLIGIALGPYEEGNEYEVMFWVAQELKKADIARIREEPLNPARLYRIQWKERLQPIGEFSSLPEDFYARLRRLLDELGKSSQTSPDAMREYEQIQRLFKDIVNCRLRKIISLASKSERLNQIVRNLTDEEQSLYQEFCRIILEWQTEIGN